MNDQQLERYSRHILLPEINLHGQQKLLASRVLIVGLGGLGSPAALYLASSGTGHITICDYDAVELSNLPRQILYTNRDLGREKTAAAAAVLQACNPDIRIATLGGRLEGPALHMQIQQTDVVVDASDNFTTRFALNAACAHENTPLVSGSVMRMGGQVTVFRLDRPGSPCYRCLFSETGESQESCADAGVLSSVAGLVGIIQATETIKLLIGLGETLEGRLLQIDGANMRFRETRFIRDPECPVCRNRAPTNGA